MQKWSIKKMANFDKFEVMYPKTKGVPQLETKAHQ